MGDADKIITVTNVGQNYSWSYFGKFDTLLRTNVMTVVAATTAGTMLNVNVDSTLGYKSGEPVIFFDKSSGAVEKTSIIDVLTSRTFTTNLKRSFPIGSWVGIDPSPIVLTSDICLGVVSTDTLGIDQTQNSTYAIMPAITGSVFTKSVPSPRGGYVAWPLFLTNPSQTTATAETRGTLRGVYAIRSGSFPALQSAGTRVDIGDDRYLIFTPTDGRFLSQNSSFNILLGPI